MKRSSKQRLIAKVIFIFLIGVIFPFIIFSLFEISLLILGVKSNFELKESGIASINIIQTPITMMISDPVLCWRTKPNSRKVFDGVEFVNNSSGFRGEEIDKPKGDGVFRIVCFGDSSTYGVFIPLEAIFTSVLEESLGKHFKNLDIEVINAGILGYSSLQMYALIDQELESLEPDLIIVAAGINDASIMTRETPEDRKFIPLYGDSLITLKYYAEHSRLLSLIIRFLFKSSDPLAPMPLPDISELDWDKKRVEVSDYEENLKKIFYKARDLSSKTIFLAFSIPPSYQEAMKRASMDTGAGFVDAESALAGYFHKHEHDALIPTDITEYNIVTNSYYESIMGKDRMDIRRDKFLFVDNCHPNAIGHEIIADSIFDVIVNELLISE